MNKRKWLAYAAGFLMIFLSLYLYYQLTGHYQTAVTTMRTLKPLRPLQAGDLITNDNVLSVLIPAAAHDSEALTDIEALSGKRLAVPLSTNEEFVPWKLAEEAITLNSGRRYYSFKTDALQNVSNMVRRGDRVDVWVEFDAPMQTVDVKGEQQLIGTVKLLENVLVADVRSAEGIEIVDSNGGGGALSALGVGIAAAQNKVPDLNRLRTEANAKPEVNTFVMNEAEYNAYVIGALSGKIKLSLANMLLQNGGDSHISAQFDRLRREGFFNQERKED